MADFVPFNSFAAKLAAGEFADIGAAQLKLALCASANAPDPVDSTQADLTEISYANVTGDMNLTTDSSGAVSTNGYRLVILDKQVAASGGDVGPFRYAAVYDDTNKDLICFYDFEDDLSISNGTSMNFDFNQTTGLFQITFVPA